MKFSQLLQNIGSYSGLIAGILCALGPGIIVGFDRFSASYILLPLVIGLGIYISRSRSKQIDPTNSFKNSTSNIISLIGICFLFFCVAQTIEILCWKMKNYTLAESINSIVQKIPACNLLDTGSVSARFPLEETNKPEVEQSIIQAYGTQSTAYKLYKIRTAG